MCWPIYEIGQVSACVSGSCQCTNQMRHAGSACREKRSLMCQGWPSADHTMLDVVPGLTHGWTWCWGIKWFRLSLIIVYRSDDNPLGFFIQYDVCSISIGDTTSKSKSPSHNSLNVPLQAFYGPIFTVARRLRWFGSPVCQRHQNTRLSYGQIHTWYSILMIIDALICRQQRSQRSENSHVQLWPTIRNGRTTGANSVTS